MMMMVLVVTRQMSKRKMSMVKMMMRTMDMVNRWGCGGFEGDMSSGELHEKTMKKKNMKNRGRVANLRTLHDKLNVQLILITPLLKM